MSEVDHIIVGSGINALVCASILAGKGEKVLLLERNDHIGGCIRSEEITVPGFVHDVMATTFVLFVTSPAYAELGADLARHGLEFCNSTKPTGVLCPDGQQAVLTTDRAVNIAAFNKLSPGAGDRHGQVVGDIEKNARLLFGLLGGRIWSFATAKLLAREAWTRGPRGLAAFLGEAVIPARGWLKPTIVMKRCRPCGYPGLCTPGWTRKKRFRDRSAKSSPLHLRPQVRQSSRAVQAHSYRRFKVLSKSVADVSEPVQMLKILWFITAKQPASVSPMVKPSMRPNRLFALLRQHSFINACWEKMLKTNIENPCVNFAMARAIFKFTMPLTARRNGQVRGLAKWRCCI